MDLYYNYYSETSGRVIIHAMGAHYSLLLNLVPPVIGTRLGSSPNGGFALACFRVFTQVLLTSTGVGTGF